MIMTTYHHDLATLGTARALSQSSQGSTSFPASSKTRSPGPRTQSANSSGLVAQSRSVKPTKHICAHVKPSSAPWRLASLSSCAKTDRAETSMSHHLTDMHRKEPTATIRTVTRMEDTTPTYCTCDLQRRMVDPTVTDTVSDLTSSVLGIANIYRWRCWIADRCWFPRWCPARRRAVLDSIVHCR